MKRINIGKLKVGQIVTIRTRNGETFRGILVDKHDWSVGCPIVEANGVIYGIGYQAEIVSVSEAKSKDGGGNYHKTHQFLITHPVGFIYSIVERCRSMLGAGATRKQAADVMGIDVKTIYKHLPASEKSLCCVGALDR